MQEPIFSLQTLTESILNKAKSPLDSMNLVWRLLLLIKQSPDEFKKFKEKHFNQLSDTPLGKNGFHDFLKRTIFNELDNSDLISNLFVEEKTETWNEDSIDILVKTIENLEKSYVEKLISILIDTYFLGYTKDKGIQKLLLTDEIAPHLIPKSLSQLMVKLVAPKIEEQVVDPYCGFGNLLAEAGHYIANTNQNTENTAFLISGRDSLSSVVETAQIYLALQKLDYHLNFLKMKQWKQNCDIPTFLTEVSNNTDRPLNILSVFPVTEQEWKNERPFLVEKKQKDQKQSKYLFNEWNTILSIVKDNKPTRLNQAVIAVNNNTLYRGRERPKRKEVLENDLLTAVIHLPCNFLYQTRAYTSILIFDIDKPPQYQNRVIFIDASQNLYKFNNFNIYLQSEIDWIALAYRQFQTQASLSQNKMARAVSLEQIKAQNWNLNIKRYLPKQQASLNPNRIAKTLSQLAQQRQQAEQEMDDCIEALGIDLEQSGGHTDSD